jgi:hypothetical protein
MKNIIMWLLYASLFFYCIVDAYQTKLLLDLGAYEANSLLAWLMDITGTWASILFFKLFFLTILLGLLIMYSVRPKQAALTSSQIGRIKLPKLNKRSMENGKSRRHVSKDSGAL